MIVSRFHDSTSGRHDNNRDEHADVIVVGGKPHQLASVKVDNFQVCNEDRSGSGSSVANESSTDMSGSKGSGDDEVPVLVKNDTKRILQLKLLLFGLIFLVAIGVCLAVYLVTADSQNNEFELA